MCVVPFLFLWKGDRIRAGSRFCKHLKEKKEKEEKLRMERSNRGIIDGLGGEAIAEKV